MIRYTTDGSRPTRASTVWDSTGPREPGEVVPRHADDDVQVARDGHQGQRRRRAGRRSGSRVERGARRERPASAGRRRRPRSLAVAAVALARARLALVAAAESERPRRGARRGGARARPASAAGSAPTLRASATRARTSRWCAAERRPAAGGRGDRRRRPGGRARRCSPTATGSCTRSGAPTRARRDVTLGEPDGLPAADQRPRLHAPASRTGWSPGSRRTSTRRGRARRRASAAARGTRYQALQLHPRASGTRSCGSTAIAGAGARAVPRARAAGRARLRAGRLPRLLVRGRRRRRRDAARARR